MTLSFFPCSHTYTPTPLLTPVLGCAASWLLANCLCVKFVCAGVSDDWGPLRLECIFLPVSKAGPCRLNPEAMTSASG